ncbi:hypothetical protein INF26_06770 [Olsenella sp. DSM 107455]|uniref:DUF559 domain-containing protein n=1 Tax=Thermophilibacter gallinarum TaxID=2779357 RepID=A0ABR9QU03_9ACTN|nr:hypothetical protein [Thermophilibacter gallinarum]MBE5024551.1 hypothetical protein [Thermophilibacter gallinarum]
MSTSRDKALATAFDAAECTKSCYAPGDYAEARAIRHRKETFIEPLPGMFFRREAWRRLTPAERSLHLMRALARQHPTWLFCGASAAVAYGLPVTWSLLTHVFAVAPPGARKHPAPGIQCRQLQGTETQTHGELPLVPFWRTVFDCLAEFELPDALAVADAALRCSGVTAKSLATFIEENFRGHRNVRRALRAARLADARAESGGESIARAQMYLLGFERPELQVWIEDPIEPGKWFRVDFLWLTSDGRIIIGEMDGRQKTERPEFMGGRDALRVMQDERLRESHLTALRPAIIRFSYDDVIDPKRFEALLSAYGVPRRTVKPPDEAPRYAVLRSELVHRDGIVHLARESMRA